MVGMYDILNIVKITWDHKNYKQFVNIRNYNFEFCKVHPHFMGFYIRKTHVILIVKTCPVCWVRL